MILQSEPRSTGCCPTFSSFWAGWRFSCWLVSPCVALTGCEGAMTIELILGGGLAALLLIYFLMALLAPERF